MKYCAHIRGAGYPRSAYVPPCSSFRPVGGRLYWRWIFPVGCHSNICSCQWRETCRRGYSDRFRPIGWSCRCWWLPPACSILKISRLSCLIFDFEPAGGSCPWDGWAWLVRLARRLPCWWRCWIVMRVHLCLLSNRVSSEAFGALYDGEE